MLEHVFVYHVIHNTVSSVTTDSSFQSQRSLSPSQTASLSGAAAGSIVQTRVRLQRQGQGNDDQDLSGYAEFDQDDDADENDGLLPPGAVVPNMAILPPGPTKSVSFIDQLRPTKVKVTTLAASASGGGFFGSRDSHLKFASDVVCFVGLAF